MAARDLEPARRELLGAACRYARLRADWAMMGAEQAGGDLDPAELGRLDERRRLAHDAFIATCNALSRRMADAGMDVGWRQRLGDHRSAAGRKDIGDFACYLHCFLGLAAR